MIERVIKPVGQVASLASIETVLVQAKQEFRAKTAGKHHGPVTCEVFALSSQLYVNVAAQVEEHYLAA
jgi:hypothetical protein